MNLLLLLFLVASEPVTQSEYNQAWLLYDNARYDEAIAAAQSIIAKDPSFHRAYSLIASASSFGAHRMDPARRYFQELSAANPADPWAYFGLGELESYTHNRAAARQNFAACVQRSNTAWPCYIGLGSNFGTERDLARALPPKADPLGVLFARNRFLNTARRFPEAIRAASQALELARKRNAPELEAKIEVFIGDALQGPARDHALSIPHYESALAIWTRLDDWQAQWESSASLIGALVEARQFGAAQDRIDNLRSSSKERLGELSLASLLSTSADIQRAAGHLDQAISLAEEFIAIKKSLRLPVDANLLHLGGLYARKGDFDTALTYMNRSLELTDSESQRPFVLRALGMLYFEHGDYALGLRYSQQSVDQFHKLKMSWQEGAGFGNLGEIYATLGDFKRAETLMHQALASAKRQNDTGEIQAGLANLGDLYLQTDRPAQALVVLKQAEALGGHTSYEAARIDTLITIAATHRALGQLPLAAAYAEKALTAAHSYSSRVQEAQASIELAAVQLASGRDRLARQNFQSALSLAESVDSPNEIVAARRGLAEVLVKTGQLPSAADQLKAAIDRLESLRAAAPGPQLRSSFISQNWRIYEELVYVLAAQHQERLAFDYAERGRARAFLDILARARPNGPLTLSAVERQASASGQVVLDYLLGDRESYLWAVSSSGTQLFRLPPRQQISAQVNAVRQAISAPGPTRDYKAPARKLFETLCAPAAALIQSANRLVIVPDGDLHYLPFEALIAPNGKFLVESAAITYAPSPSTLNLLNRTRPVDRRRELAAIGAPRTASLPFANTELTQIAAMFPAAQTTLLIGNDATAGAVRNAKLSDFKRLHFATHTVFDDRAPAATGIVLTPSAQDDGILRSSDILKLHLDADLVVLSACQTGLGKLVRGEGIAGLSQAFLYAGAQRIVVSTWEVNDLATSDLMTSFYRGLTHNIAPAEALQQAKLQLLNSGAPAYRHPYYWASFVNIGAF
jgi:CHAT domain-containing protein